MLEEKVVKQWLPMPNKVVVKVVEDKTTWDRAGRIIKPDTIAQPRTTALVIAVYEPFVDSQDNEVGSYVQVGDYVVFGKHGGIELAFGEEKVVVLWEKEILTKVVFNEPAAPAAAQFPTEPFDDLEG